MHLKFNVIDLIKPVSNETQQNRISICNECVEFNKTTHICDQCGCFMPIKTKLENQKCPLGNW